jgi:hypothetical protein
VNECDSGPTKGSAVFVGGIARNLQPRAASVGAGQVHPEERNSHCPSDTLVGAITSGCDPFLEILAYDGYRTLSMRARHGGPAFLRRVQVGGRVQRRGGCAGGPARRRGGRDADGVRQTPLPYCPLATSRCSMRPTTSDSSGERYSCRMSCFGRWPDAVATTVYLHYHPIPSSPFSSLSISPLSSFAPSSPKITPKRLSPITSLLLLRPPLNAPPPPHHGPSSPSHTARFSPLTPSPSPGCLLSPAPFRRTWPCPASPRPPRPKPVTLCTLHTHLISHHP